MKLNLIIRNALKRQGVKAETIEAALTAIQPKRIHFKRQMVRRIEDMVAKEGVAVVTRKQVASWKGCAVRKMNAAHLNKSAKKQLASTIKTPATIARSLPHA